MMSNYKLNEEIKVHCKQFLLGLQRVIPLEWIQLFDEYEL
jgi:hypothetical protein